MGVYSASKAAMRLRARTLATDEVAKVRYSDNSSATIKLQRRIDRLLFLANTISQSTN